MAKYGPFTTGRLYAGGFDFTGNLREMSVQYGAEMLDATVFGQTTKVNQAGLRTITATASGFADFTLLGQDPTAYSYIGLSTVPVALAIPASSGGTLAEADRALFFQASLASYQLGGAHGAILPFSFQAQSGASGDPLIRGYVAETGLTQRSAGGNGTGSNSLGALSAAETLFAALFVSQSSGGNLVVTLQSDDAADFVGAATRITFTTATAQTYQYATPITGAITDTYWRALWTLSAGTATFALVYGKGTL